MKPRVVFDTNILVSAIVFGGNPKACLDMAHKKQIDAFTSKALLLELSAKLHSKFYWPDTEIENALRNIKSAASIVQPDVNLIIITTDLSDNAVLEIAVEAQADYIVSGDKRHILPLKKYKNTQIVTAARFLEIINI